ncbi:hypothetical protein [Tessaracoccus caeni]|uniref:hypothetical protein n=1 Tax=Tessaracoccus caeni TaxID=3031239 RepID=UPI0023D9F080|nr:hypothetical protein [Tessaracoccus caeni]MDF1489999.1 hypothetical protein [Tessaracoccus caeni]
MKSNEVRILVIDDTPGRHTLLSQGDAKFRVLHPLDVDDFSLEGIDLICVDEYLGQDWAAKIQGLVSDLPALHNSDGLAVAAALRSRARLADRSGAPGFAVALFTADLGRLSEGLPESRQEPLTASMHDLEWVFRFEGGPAGFGDRVEELASAARSITGIDVAANGHSWLGLGARAWADLARAQIDDCRPPQSALAKSTSGRSYLRWLAQRVLPYPTFVLDEEYAANLMGIEVAAFRSDAVQTLLASQQAKYSGPLRKSFLGRRWWRAALQHILEEAGVSAWDAPHEKAEALSRFIGSAVAPLDAVNPVVCYGPSGDVVAIDAEAEDCVRIQLDGWPLFADEAWAQLDVARTVPEVRALVAHDDVARLSE